MNCYIDKKTVAQLITKCETALKFAQENYEKPYGETFEEIIETLKPFLGKKEYTTTSKKLKITKCLFTRHSLDEINEKLDIPNLSDGDFVRLEEYRVLYNKSLSNPYEEIVWSNWYENTLVYKSQDYIN